MWLEDRFESDTGVDGRCYRCHHRAGQVVLGEDTQQLLQAIASQKSGFGSQKSAGQECRVWFSDHGKALQESTANMNGWTFCHSAKFSNFSAEYPFLETEFGLLNTRVIALFEYGLSEKSFRRVIGRERSIGPIPSLLPCEMNYLKIDRNWVLMHKQVQP